MTSALSLTGVCKRFGDARIINNVDLTLQPAERHAVIGPNGAGKSTLFNLITGRYPATRGRVSLHGKNISGLPPHRICRRGLSRSFQVTNLFENMTAFDNLRCALLWSRGYRYSFWRLMGRQKVLNREAGEWLARLGLYGRRDVTASYLTYAEQRALEIGTTIAGGADVILLDEPTAGMSLPERNRMMDLIRGATEDKALLIIEHDMDVVFDLADRISVLVHGRVLASGMPDVIRGDPQVRQAYLGE